MSQTKYRTRDGIKFINTKGNIHNVDAPAFVACGSVPELKRLTVYAEGDRVVIPVKTIVGNLEPVSHIYICSAAGTTDTTQPVIFDTYAGQIFPGSVVVTDGTADFDYDSTPDQFFYSDGSLYGKNIRFKTDADDIIWAYVSRIKNSTPDSVWATNLYGTEVWNSDTGFVSGTYYNNGAPLLEIAGSTPDAQGALGNIVESPEFFQVFGLGTESLGPNLLSSDGTFFTSAGWTLGVEETDWSFVTGAFGHLACTGTTIQILTGALAFETIPDNVYRITAQVTSGTPNGNLVLFDGETEETALAFSSADADGNLTVDVTCQTTLTEIAFTTTSTAAFELRYIEVRKVTPIVIS